MQGELSGLTVAARPLRRAGQHYKLGAAAIVHPCRVARRRLSRFGTEACSESCRSKGRVDSPTAPT